MSVQGVMRVHPGWRVTLPPSIPQAMGPPALQELLCQGPGGSNIGPFQEITVNTRGVFLLPHDIRTALQLKVGDRVYVEWAGYDVLRVISVDRVPGQKTSAMQSTDHQRWRRLRARPG